MSASRQRPRRNRTASSMRSAFTLLVLCSIALSVSADEPDPSRGPELFKPCSACHAVGPGAIHRFGPELNGILQRGAGAAENYQYSRAFDTAVGKGLAWDGPALDRYLESPLEVLPGTKMAYPGLKDAEDRADLIAWMSMIEVDGTLPLFDDETDAPHESDAPTPSSIAARDVPLPEHGELHLGRPALSEEVDAWDIDVRPDGSGLPEGSGDVLTGTDLYDAQCAACHGVFGEGEGRWPVLAGGFESLTEDRPEKTIGSYWPYLSTVYDYVRRAMPFGNARSLSDDDVYALTAYLMYLNDLVDEDFELSSKNFGEVRLPNEENFIADTRQSEPQYHVSEEPCMSDCREGDATVTMRAQVLDVTPDGEEGDEESGGAAID